MLDAMDDPLRVSIPDLRAALNRALDTTQALLGAEITVPVDYYWHVPVEAAFDMANEPELLTVGQVSDDIAEIVHDDHDRVAEEAWHDLSHLVGVLRALEFAARSWRRSSTL